MNSGGTLPPTGVWVLSVWGRFVRCVTMATVERADLLGLGLQSGLGLGHDSLVPRGQPIGVLSLILFLLVGGETGDGDGRGKRESIGFRLVS